MFPEKNNDSDQVFDKLRLSLLYIDPVAFAEHYLTLEGAPFRLRGNGFKPFADIYRYIGIKALEKDSLPLVLCKSRQVGGTVMASILSAYFLTSGIFGTGNKSPIRIIHSFPQLELAATYCKTKFNSLISSSLAEVNDSINKGAKRKSYMQSLLDTSSPTNDSLHFKQFVGGNHIFIESIGIDGNRIMGRTSDVIFFDEVQSTTSQAIGSALKTLTTAKYGPPSQGVQVYFGTPRRKGSDYHKMWQSSSQQYYYLGCLKCEKHFPLYTPGSDEWETIWLHGFIVKCPHCGEEQDKRVAAEKGKWVSLRPNDDKNYKFIGFHINQLYYPTFTKEALLAQKPEVHPINTERLYQNEVLGEFFDGDSSPITQEEIREKCGDIGRKFRKTIVPGEKQMVLLGIDYGLRADLDQLSNPDKATKNAGQSYSTAVVLSAEGAGLLSIEFACKFPRNDLESKKSIIAKLMREYSVNLTVGDIGYSNDLSPSLYMVHGDKYIVSRAHGKLTNHIKLISDSFPKEIIFERDHYIGELFEQLKAGKIRFPYGQYEKLAWLIEHCASMELKPSISRTGDPTLHYVKGGTPNDGFMALLNAYIAYKYMLTKGFTLMNPLLQDQSFKEKNQPLALVGYVKKRF
jgi:hypothetical protein